MINKVLIKLDLSPIKKDIAIKKIHSIKFNEMYLKLLKIKLMNIKQKAEKKCPILSS